MHQSIQTSIQCTIGSDMETPLLKDHQLPNKSIQTSTQCITGSDMEILSLREAPLLKPSH
jgi:hypothetical protein